MIAVCYFAFRSQGLNVLYPDSLADCFQRAVFDFGSFFDDGIFCRVFDIVDVP